MSVILQRLINFILNKNSKHTSKLIDEYLSPGKLKKLESILGYPIKNKEYFIQALVHRSFLEQNNTFDTSNERLEYLGDAVLNLIIAEYLFEEFPDKNEGFLTKIRSKLVNKYALSEAAEVISLSDYLLVSKNLSPHMTFGSKTVLADAVEALIGAIYLDSGISVAKSFINKIIIEPNTKEGVYLIDENYKSQLLEFAQANKLDIPVYVLVKEEGPHHEKKFTTKVLIGDVEYGIGTGRNKKSSEQNAAKLALEKIKNIPSNS